MVSVTVGTMVAASSENAVQQGSSSNDKIQLDTRWQRLVEKNEFEMHRSWYEQSSNSLCPFLLSLPMPKWPMQLGQELWSYPGIEVPEQEQVFCGRDHFNGGLHKIRPLSQLRSRV